MGDAQSRESASQHELKQMEEGRLGCEYSERIFVMRYPRQCSGSIFQADYERATQVTPTFATHSLCEFKPST